MGFLREAMVGREVRRERSLLLDFKGFLLGGYRTSFHA